MQAFRTRRVVDGGLREACCWWLWTALGVIVVSVVNVCVPAAGSSAMHESAAAAIPDRKADILFHPETSIRGRLVTCDNVSDADYRFPAETWSCYNMRYDDDDDDDSLPVVQFHSFID
jgi:hypothetical protein